MSLGTRALLLSWLFVTPISSTTHYTARLQSDNIFLELSSERQEQDFPLPGTQISQVNGLYEIDVEGWNYLELEGLSSNDFLQEKFLAGFVEGYATCKQLFESYPNFIYDNFGTEPPDQSIVDFLTENYAYMQDSVSSSSASSSRYWMMVHGFLEQLQGILNGVQSSPCMVDSTEFKRFTRQRFDLEDIRFSNLATTGNFSLMHLLLLNAWGDLGTITDSVSAHATRDSVEVPLDVLMETPNSPRIISTRRAVYPGTAVERLLRCSSMFKLLPDKSDILYGHTTWSSFIALGPRIFKRYNLITPTADSSTLGFEMRSVSFSSSPGTLASLDDFYIVKSATADLVVIETTNAILNPSLYDLVTPYSLLCWIRGTTANALAVDGASWATAFGYNHSGTYPNQWMVLDVSKFKPGASTLSAGLFVVSEEIPGKFVTADLTSVLEQTTYWASYNVPYFQEISIASGNTAACRMLSTVNDTFTEYCYNSASRAQIFRQRQTAVSTVDDLAYLLQYNDWENDPLSYANPCKAIACRGDLQPSLAMRHPSGGLDGKVSSLSLAANSKNKPYVKARIGPTFDDQPVFCWSQLEKPYVHVGQPDCWDFDWVEFV